MHTCNVILNRVSIPCNVGSSLATVASFVFEASVVALASAAFAASAVFAASVAFAASSEAAEIREPVSHFRSSLNQVRRKER